MNYSQLPSMVVSQDEHGRLFFEVFHNGARRREYLADGTELTQIRSELSLQSDRLRAARNHEARVIAREEAERKRAAELHSRVYTITAQHHGVGFASKCIGGKRPRGLSVKPKIKEWNGLLP